MSTDYFFTPAQAYEAAKIFAKIAKENSERNGLMSEIQKQDSTYYGVIIEEIYPTLDSDFLKTCLKEFQKLEQFSYIEKYYITLKNSPNFKKRPVHHQVKPENVVFDLNFKATTVLRQDCIWNDLFWCDIGEMFRTFLCVGNENERDFSRLDLRKEYFKATVEGYLSEMKSVLTAREKETIIFAGKYQFYLRISQLFVDYFTTKEESFLLKIQNQIYLLSQFSSREDELKDYANL